jgi:hypothetical protein
LNSSGPLAPRVLEVHMDKQQSGLSGILLSVERMADIYAPLPSPANTETWPLYLSSHAAPYRTTNSVKQFENWGIFFFFF